MKREGYVPLLIPLFTLVLIISAVAVASNVNDAQIVNVALVAGLVGVTTWYAYSTAKMTNEMKRQAEASVKMAEEMRVQTIMTSRPYMIPKAMPVTNNGVETDNFSHFEVYNEGKIPAIEVVTYLQNKEGHTLANYRETSVGAGGQAIPRYASQPGQHFDLTNLSDGDYSIVCTYQGIFPLLTRTRIQYRARLPFHKGPSCFPKGGIRLDPRGLEFTEVRENEAVRGELVEP